MENQDIFIKIYKIFLKGNFTNKIDNNLTYFDFYDSSLISFSVNLSRNINQFRKSKFIVFFKYSYIIVKRFIKNYFFRFETMVDTEKLSGDKNSKKIIFTVNEINHLSYILNLMTILQDKNENFLIVTSNEIVKRKVKSLDFDYIFFKKKIFFQIGFNNLLSKISSISFPDYFFNFLNINSLFKKLIIKKSVIDISSSYVSSFQIAKYLDNYHNFEKLFLINDLSVFGRTLTIELKKKNKKVISMMHGTLMHEYSIANFYLDRFYLFGKNDLKNLLSYKIPKENLVVMGNPIFDNIQHRKFKKPVSNLKNKFSLSYKKTVLIATSGSGRSVSDHHHKKLIKSFFEISKKNKEVLFIIKLHKSQFKDNIENYKPYLTNHKSNNLQIIEYYNNFSQSIFDWIYESDLVITGLSTTGLESLALKVPAICYDLNKEFTNNEIFTENLIYCQNESALQEKLDDLVKGEKLISNADFETFIENFYFMLDNKSSEKIVEDLLKT